uniref:CUE domain-containing protein n=1 Tax=Angiostrongylus cantonensis TaxID=6313 RepID=A0A0K0DLF0_ANGCA
MSGQQTEELLEFETAMKDFSMMFPSISRSEIERMLRKNDGDVATTIDDLLFSEGIIFSRLSFHRRQNDRLTMRRRQQQTPRFSGAYIIVDLNTLIRKKKSV